MNTRTVSIKDVADRAGVAVGTVSNVLNYPDRVSEGTRSRVLGAIEELGFVRNDAARQLRAGLSRAIGLIVLDVSNPFFSTLARAAEEAAALTGNTVVLGDSGHDIDREARYIDVFEQQRVRGLLVSPVGELGDRLDSLLLHGLSVVLVDRLDARRRVSSVSVDDVAGGYIAVRHLLDGGRRRIAFVGASTGIQQVADRLAGARKAISEEPDALLDVVEAESMTVLAGRTAGELIAARGSGDRPDAIFCANDLLAIGVMQAVLLTRGLKIPDDVALIGYDDIDFAQSAVVPLSTVRRPTSLIAENAVQLLLEDIDNPGRETQQVVFQPTLVARDSTAAKLDPAD